MTSLRKRKLLTPRDEANPPEGALNIVDAMLVFACGLMLALVVYWRTGPAFPFDTKSLEAIELKQMKEVTQLPEVKRGLREVQEGGELYEKVGTVYRDPRTGKLFLVITP